MEKFEYNPSDDEVLDSEVVENDTGKSGYEITLRRYKKGDLKIQYNYWYVSSEDNVKHYLPINKRIPFDKAVEISKKTIDMWERADAKL